MINRSTGAIITLLILGAGCSATESRHSEPPQVQKIRHPALANMPVPGGLGVNIHFYKGNDRDLRMLAASGIGIVRMDWSWGGMEHEPGKYDFSERDALVADMEKVGARILFIIDYGNKLYDEGQSPRSDECRKAYANMCRAMAARYKGKAIIWELWNEPNIGFWTPKPDVEDYMKWVKAVVPAIREGDPGACIIGPASSCFPWDFFDGCISRGYLDLIDGFSVHPYRGHPPETTLADYERLRRLIDRSAPAGKDIPIISGEWGYNCTDIAPDLQGKYLPRQWLTNLSAGIPISIWYDWHDDGPDPNEREHNFGTVRLDYAQKHAYDAMCVLIRELWGYSFSHRLMLDSPEDFFLVFEKDGRVKIAFWTAGKDHETLLPFALPSGKAVDHLGNLISVSGGSKIALSPSPVYFGPVEIPPLLAADKALRIDATAETNGGGEVFVRLRFANPLNIHVAAKPGELKSAGLKGEWQDTGAEKLPPGGSTEFLWRGRMVRRDLARTDFSTSLIVKPDGQPSEWTLIRCGNVTNSAPLGIRVGVTDKGFCLVLDGSPGQTLAGVLRCKVDGVQHEGQPVSIRFLREAQQVLPLAFAPDEGKVCEIEAVILDADGNVALTIENGLYRVEESFCDKRAESDFRALLDGDNNDPAKVSMEIAPSPGNAPPFPTSLKIDYQFGAGWRFLKICPTTKLNAENPKIVSFWLYGDGSGDAARCRLTDSGGQTFQPTAPDAIHGPAWRLVSLPVDPRAGHWGGADDGVMRPPFIWDSIYLHDSQPRRAHSGTVYISGVVTCRDMH
ncbi:MAG TPA: cellulase family glycosylhydrolase [Candidatus Brocadiia bacterium]|nr:cellulase family glycosylhydrolase [Candidatus Brocadiia bacterium]